MNELGRAQVAAQRIVRLRYVEQQQVAAAHRRRKRAIGIRRRVDQEEMRAGVRCLQDRGRHVRRRFDHDAIEREVRVQEPDERRRFIDADLGAGERMLGRLEDDPVTGTDRRVARIAVDLDESDFDVLLRCRRLGLAPVHPGPPPWRSRRE